MFSFFVRLKGWSGCGDCNRDFGTEQVAWLSDAIKGVIRHDRETLLEWFTEETKLHYDDRRRWLRRVRRLETRGILHSDLLPYLWPDESDATQGFWEFAKEQHMEKQLWQWGAQHPVAPNAGARARILTLLEAFDLAMPIPSSPPAPGTEVPHVEEQEWLIPSLRCVSSLNLRPKPSRRVARSWSQLRLTINPELQWLIPCLRCAAMEHREIPKP
jgi:hypothetical protein